MFPYTSFYITGNAGVDGSVIFITYKIDIILLVVIYHYFLYSIVQMNKVWLFIHHCVYAGNRVCDCRVASLLAMTKIQKLLAMLNSLCSVRGTRQMPAMGCFNVDVFTRQKNCSCEISLVLIQ